MPRATERRARRRGLQSAAYSAPSPRVTTSSDRSPIGLLRAPGSLHTLAVGLIIFLLAFDRGSFSLQSRGTLAICLWWLVGLAFLFALWPRSRIPRAAGA